MGQSLIAICVLAAGLIYSFPPQTTAVQTNPFPVLPKAAETAVEVKNIRDVYTGTVMGEALIRYRHAWTEPAGELVPGRPFGLKFQVEEAERRLPEKILSIGEMNFMTGVLVTAGREWVEEFLKNDRNPRKELAFYDVPTPSPQLYLAADATAGLLSTTDPQTHDTKMVWKPSASVDFVEPIPDKIPDKDNFATPKENIPGELLLVIIYARDINGYVYLDTNYLYEDVKTGGGAHVWKLLRRWSTEDLKWTGHDGDMIVVMNR